MTRKREDIMADWTTLVRNAREAGTRTARARRQQDEPRAQFEREHFSRWLRLYATTGEQTAERAKLETAFADGYRAEWNGE